MAISPVNEMSKRQSSISRADSEYDQTTHALHEYYARVESTQYSLIDIPLTSRISMERYWASTSFLGKQLGQYLVDRVLYQGTVSAVLVAKEQNQVKREVAIKILNPYAPDPVKKLFRLEQEAVLKLAHPYVISIYQIGEDSDQTPFIVMELVNGVPLYKYCEQNQLNLLNRFLLLEKVCEAVAYCHDHGISHGDIKSANILVVDDGATPKPIIIDFGIATNADTAKTASDSPRMGTPETMSPEHLDHKARVTKNSDIYSLGMLLFGLLIGKIPFDRVRFQQLTIHEQRRRFREFQPGPPSRFFYKCSTEEREQISQHYPRSDQSKLSKFIGQELDWIFGKATAIQPEARYQSALALRHDLKNLRGLWPLSIAPDKRSYRLIKFTQRNPILSATSAIFVMTFLAWIVSVSVIKSQEIKAAARADQQANSTAAVTNLSKSIIDLANPYLSENVLEENLSYLLDQSYQQLESNTDLDPTIKASLLLRNWQQLSKSFRE